jgi:glycosyltransferase involved in cell wall biosynthesis
MARLLGVDDDVLRVVPLGIRLDQYAAEPLPRPAERPPTIGYLARICPEKGLHLLVDAFAQLAREPGRESLRLRVAGYLGPKDREYFAKLQQRVAELGLAGRFDHVGEVDLAGKVSFLRSLDLLAVPTVYREPKGLFALEAMANGVPVVLPRHGSFPEVLEETGGGLLVEPASAESLAAGLRALLDASSWAAVAVPRSSPPVARKPWRAPLPRCSPTPCQVRASASERASVGIGTPPRRTG